MNRCLLDIVADDRKLEIDVTFLAPRYWGTLASTECKFVLLDMLRAEWPQHRERLASRPQFTSE
ncbi:hypothetical protein [Massilia sp. PWRC2]|uniref:hypothetical protein n=1 Tax=Massilia sp. PWRC2 TaxID=2804626 RepID=UPI003CEBC213